MKRFSVINALVLVSLGIFTYSVKNRVVELESQYHQVQREIVQIEESIYMLEGEWSYLTRPERLHALLIKHQKLHSVEGYELVSFEKAGEVLEDAGQLPGKIIHASLRMR